MICFSDSGNHPKTLFHYTTFDTLNYIFHVNEEGAKEIRLWATEHKFMNDPKEIRRGREIVKTMFLPNVNPYIKDELQRTYLSKDTRCYILSLSEAGDCLPMWNTYAGWGTGICLEFDTNHFRNEFLGKCAYDKKLFESEIRRILEQGDPPLQVALDIGADSLCIKSPDYEYEKEYRYVKHGFKIGTDKLRLRKGEVVHYIEHAFPVAALRSIIVGPNLNQTKTIASIKTYLGHKGIEGIRLKKSRVQYKTR